jgi:3-dehydroquinate synthase
MKNIRVNLKEHSYDIVTGKSILPRLGKFIRRLHLGRDAYIITNAAIQRRYGSLLKRSLQSAGFNFKFSYIPDSEESKSLDTAYSVINDLARYDRQKQLFIIAFGGGVVGDLAGFIASIYKRGIPYVQAGTTLLAQVDSSIGGKTGVDLKTGKNLIGSFYQPRLVLSDVSLLHTLDPRQLRSGMAEVIKYGIIKDPLLFAYLEKHSTMIAKNRVDGLDLEFIVSRCAASKAKIVEQDEKEKKGLRTILNFGHTIGHAIEAAGHYTTYTHGEAIALGMLVATDISSLLEITSAATAYRIRNLIETTGLPVRINKISAQEIIKAHYSDKKFTGSRNKFVLIEKIGRTKIVENISLKIIQTALAPFCI